MHSLLFLVLIVTSSLVSLYFGLSSSPSSSSSLLLIHSSSSVVLKQQQPHDQPNFIQHDHEFVSLSDFLSFFDDDELVPPSSTVCVKVPSSSSSKNKNDVSAGNTAMARRRQYLKFFTHHLVAQLSFPFHWKYPDTSLYWGLSQQGEENQENDFEKQQKQTSQEFYSMVKLSSHQSRSSSVKRNSTRAINKKTTPPALSELVDPFVHPGARFPLYKKFGDKLQSISCHHGVPASSSDFSSSRCCVQKKTSSDIIETRANKFKRLPDCHRGGAGTRLGVCQIPEMFVV